jgi:hypothetical protein
LRIIIALSSLWLPLCAYAEVGSCYTKTYDVTFYDSGQEKLGEATSFIKASSIDAEKIQFEFQSYGANFHTCTVPGFALKQKMEVISS